MKLITRSYAESFYVNRDNVLDSVDLGLIAGFLYEDVRALPYKIRHGLMMHFPDPKLFGSGKSAWRGKKTFSSEELANLLFNLFLRATKKHHFVYKSGYGFRLFDLQKHPMTEAPLPRNRIDRSAVPMVLKTNKKGVEGTGKHLGQEAIFHECSSFSWSFCQVLVAFGFNPAKVGIQVVQGNQQGDYAVVRCKPDLIKKYNSIYGVDLSGALSGSSVYDPGNKGGCDRFTAPRSSERTVKDLFFQYALQEFDNYRKGAGYSRNWNALNTAMKATGMKVASMLNNTIAVSEVGLIEPTNRDVFENHLCAYILPEGSELNKWKATFFDPLYELRYANGLPDLFEIYTSGPLKNFKLSQSKFAPPGSTTTQYVSSENKKRCLFRLPEAMYPIYIDFCSTRRRQGEEHWTEGLITIDDIPGYLLSWMTFDYESDGERSNDLNFFEYMQKRHAEIFIVVDERDYTGKKRTRDMHHWVIGWLRERINALAEKNEKDGVKVTPKLTRRKSMSAPTGSLQKQRPRSKSVTSGQKNPYI